MRTGTWTGGLVAAVGVGVAGVAAPASGDAVGVECGTVAVVEEDDERVPGNAWPT